MHLRLTVVFAIFAVLAVGTLMFAGPITSSEAWSLETESAGVSAAATGEGEQLPEYSSAPNARAPQPVNQQIEEEFNADPPWQSAQEQAEREAAEREAAQREEIEGEAAEMAAKRCVVPSLEGKTLAAARTSLRESHCKLDLVGKPRRPHGPLVVRAQSPQRNETLASGAVVAVRVGRSPRGRHRR